MTVPNIAGFDVGNHGVSARVAGVVEPQRADHVVTIGRADKAPLLMTRAGAQKEIIGAERLAIGQGGAASSEGWRRQPNECAPRRPEMQMARLPTTAVPRGEQDRVVKFIRTAPV